MRFPTWFRLENILERLSRGAIVSDGTYRLDTPHAPQPGARCDRPGGSSGAAPARIRNRWIYIR